MYSVFGMAGAFFHPIPPLIEIRGFLGFFCDGCHAIKEFL